MCLGAFEVWQLAQVAGFNADCKLYTTLISTCAKSGKVDTMFEVRFLLCSLFSTFEMFLIIYLLVCCNYSSLNVFIVFGVICEDSETPARPSLLNA